jgi:hypothetical protein
LTPVQISAFNGIFEPGSGSSPFAEHNFYSNLSW